MINTTTQSDTKLPQLEENDYLLFQNLLHERYGLYFSDRRRSELDLGIRHAFATSNCTSLSEYYALLTGPNPSPIELDRLINAVTINETHFFRDAAQFNALYNEVLPEIIKRQRPMRMLRIWSAGCASGEEPYSIAMLLRELLPDVDEWAITILGTDINTEALDRARRAVYGEWAFREDRARQWRSRYFQPAPGHRHELTPAIREMVTFQRLNLAEPSYPSFETDTMALDLILCRNVTIYFVTYRRFHTYSYPDTIVYRRDGQSAQRLTEQPSDPLTQAGYLGLEWLTQPAPPPLAPSVATESPPVMAQSGVPPSPSKEIDPLEQASEWLEYGHTEQARDLLLDFVRQQPNDAQACLLLGQAYANLAEWLPAEQWCRRATRINALALKAYYTLALVLQHQPDLERAIEAMRTVTYLDRNNVLGHYGLANLYYANRQLPRAYKSLDNARRLLAGRTDDEMIPDSGGITAGRLREAVIRQQQQWNVEPLSARGR